MPALVSPFRADDKATNAPSPQTREKDSGVSPAYRLRKRAGALPELLQLNAPESTPTASPVHAKISGNKSLTNSTKSPLPNNKRSRKARTPQHLEPAAGSSASHSHTNESASHLASKPAWAKDNPVLSRPEPTGAHVPMALMAKLSISPSRTAAPPSVLLNAAAAMRSPISNHQHGSTVRSQSVEPGMIGREGSPGQQLELERDASDSVPFSRLRNRHFLNERVSNLLKTTVGKQDDLTAHQNNGVPSLLDVAETMQNRNPSSRAEAVVLNETFTVMANQICGSTDPTSLSEKIKEQSRLGNTNSAVDTLNPVANMLDHILSEIGRQVSTECAERGVILSRLRHYLRETFRAAFDGITFVNERYRRACDDMIAYKKKVEPAVTQREFMEDKITSLQAQVAQLEARLRDGEVALAVAEAKRRAEIDELIKEREAEKQAALDREDEQTALVQVLSSKLSVAEMDVKNRENRIAQGKVRIDALETRAIRDAASIEHLHEQLARFKIVAAWFRSLALMKKKKWEKIDVSTSCEDLVANDTSNVIKEQQEKKKKAKQLSQAIPFHQFWERVVRRAADTDITRNLSLLYSKAELLKLVGDLYSQKIIVDDIDDKSHTDRQPLPEFLYDHYLQLEGNPESAENCLVKIVANVLYHERFSTRVRSFGRFLALSSNSYNLDGLNVFLAALVRARDDATPLLEKDLVHIDQTRMVSVLQYVFARVSYVTKQKVIQEGQKEFSSRTVDLDEFLAFIMTQWQNENSRLEERLRALFVASDSDGDGNLDFDEFQSMIQHTHTTKSQRSLLKMYAEMTLNKHVDCNTFVRVARKHRFFSFEVGSAKPKLDKDQKDMFKVLDEAWRKQEALLHELLIVLEGTGLGRRVEERIVALRKLMLEKAEPERAYHLYRMLMAELAVAIRNRAPDPEVQAILKEALSSAAKSSTNSRPGSRSSGSRGQHSKPGTPGATGAAVADATEFDVPEGVGHGTELSSEELAGPVPDDAN